MSLALSSIWLKNPGAAADYLTNSPQVSIFQNDQPRHYPYSFLYNEIPAKENSFDYNRSLTFSLDKNCDLIGQMYLRMQVSRLNYAPVRDNDIVRACFLADLPDQPGSSMGGLSELDAAPVLIDYMGWLLMESAELFSSTTSLDKIRGDYLFAAEDLSKNDSANRITSLAPNAGGANNLGYTQDQNLYVPLSFFCGKDPSSYYPICKLHYADAKVKVKVGPAPFRGDATGFQVGDFDADTEAAYAAEHGPDVLPHQMYERYMLLRKGSVGSDFAVSLVLQNGGDRLQGTFVPRYALQFTLNGLTTQDRSVSDNVLQLVRRKSYRIDTSRLQLQEPVLVSGGQTTFIWDYANTAAAITCTGHATGGMIRLYGTYDLQSSSTNAQITYNGGSFRVHTVTNNATSETQDVPVPPSSSSTWQGGAGLPVVSNIVFRIDPARISELSVGDSFSFQLSKSAVQLPFTIATSENGQALPATYLQTAQGYESFQYSSAMSTDTSLMLASQSPPALKGYTFPSWVPVLSNGNLLFYHLGNTLPANVRGSLSGVVVGCPADNQSFDYLGYDPGLPVDAEAADGTLVSTGQNGLFPPFFPTMGQRPALRSAPRGTSPLPVYCYTVSNGDGDVASYTPVVKGSTIARFSGPNSDVGGELKQCSLVTTGVFLDDAERLPLLKANYKKLIQSTQAQEFRVTAGLQSPARFKLNFTGPTRELLFYFRPDVYNPHSDTPVSSQNYWDWTTTDGNDFYATATVCFNNTPMHDPPRDPVFFQYLMPGVTHDSIPKQRISCIPFAMTGLDAVAPVGDIDLSAFDSIELTLTFPDGALKDTGTLYVFARGENVITIVAGASGPVFAF